LIELEKDSMLVEIYLRALGLEKTVKDCWDTIEKAHTPLWDSQCNKAVRLIHPLLVKRLTKADVMKFGTLAMQAVMTMSDADIAAEKARKRGIRVRAGTKVRKAHEDGKYDGAYEQTSDRHANGGYNDAYQQTSDRHANGKFDEAYEQTSKRHKDNHEQVKAAAETEWQQRRQRWQDEEQQQDEREGEGQNRQQQEQQEEPFVLTQEAADVVAAYERQWTMTPEQQLLLDQIKSGRKTLADIPEVWLAPSALAIDEVQLETTDSVLLDAAKLKGCTRGPRDGLWIARIGIGNLGASQQVYLGVFTSRVACHEAYDDALARSTGARVLKVRCSYGGRKQKKCCTAVQWGRECSLSIDPKQFNFYWRIDRRCGWEGRHAVGLVL
jgi:hypothetical protein